MWPGVCRSVLLRDGPDAEIIRCANTLYWTQVSVQREQLMCLEFPFVFKTQRYRIPGIPAPNSEIRNKMRPGLHPRKRCIPFSSFHLIVHNVPLFVPRNPLTVLKNEAIEKIVDMVHEPHTESPCTVRCAIEVQASINVRQHVGGTKRSLQMGVFAVVVDTLFEGGHSDSGNCVCHVLQIFRNGIRRSVGSGGDIVPPHVRCAQTTYCKNLHGTGL